jgi:hypothetical protein
LLFFEKYDSLLSAFFFTAKPLRLGSKKKADSFFLGNIKKQKTAKLLNLLLFNNLANKKNKLEVHLC